jgi:hypothetical protein
MYVALALLFQPLEKVTLGRQVWIIVDLMGGGGVSRDNVYTKEILTPKSKP